jgi:N-acetyl sugar amidotransferase
MPSSRPRVRFNSDGICNACTNAEDKKKINWSKREAEFFEILEKIKNNKENNSVYDCIVPWSGGKDSTSIALKLKKFGLNPLLVTFSPLIINECGQKNRNSLINRGFDAILVQPNNHIARKLAKRFFIERGNPKVAWDAGINSTPVQIAVNYKIPYIFYAEHGESEYGGLVLSEESKKIRDTQEVIEHQIGDYPENWVNDEISYQNLNPYIFPEKSKNEQNITAYYFSYFFKWSMLENYHYVKKEMPEFEENPNGRTEGTFTNFDSLDDKIDDLYYYMQFIKFGFGRATRDSCRMIQNNQMTRKEAIKMARKFDGEEPKIYFKEVLNYLDINEEKYFEIIEKHRNSEIWKKDKNYWKLKFKI